MLLKSWRVKKLIAHRQRRSLEDLEDAQESYLANKKPLISTPRRLSWLSQNPYPEGSLLRRVDSSTTTQTKPLPLTIDTNYSSTSSLCSCECETKSFPDGCSLSKTSKPPVGVLYLPPGSPTQSGDAKAWQLIFSEPVSRASTSDISIAETKISSEINARLSAFDLLQALSIEPMNTDKTPTQGTRYVEELEMDDLLADVDQLIRETDEAFRAIGTALADPNAATQGWYNTPEPTTIIAHTPTIHPGALKNNTFRTSASTIQSPLSRSVAVSKNKNKRRKISPFSKKRKTNILSHAVKSAPLPPASTLSRWNLTDVTATMVDMFNGKMFRPEVDEMLTPGRMLRLKQELRTENERRVSIESFKSEEAECSTPTEPFHLEGLVSRIEMLRKESSCPIPPQPPPALSKSKRSVTLKGTLETAMEIHELQFPIPPQQPSTQKQSHSYSNSHIPQLPTIPEVSPLSFPLTPIEGSFQSPKQKSKLPPTLTHFHPQNFIDLPSTSFTLTSPIFRHGPIRLHHERFFALNRAQKSNYSLMDEVEGDGEEGNLDWTAFQVAILGTMDDGWENNEEVVKWDEKVCQDLSIFWTDLGFHDEHLGRMTKKEDLDSELEALEVNIGLDGPRINPARENLRIDNRRFKKAHDYESMMQGLQISEQGVGGSQYRYNMPPSPVVNLEGAANTRIADGDVVVPMRFNLEHDLGEFLNWEAMHSVCTPTP
ncbi:hypothetical protein BGZ60DRAFT_428083 [Tricladium varicosporioides]|nr:hypothetical protein BGZ60DRAFT_428083 [Hymenoscyphus varicosporioides]